MLKYKVQLFRRSVIASLLLTVLAGHTSTVWAGEKNVEFNTDVLDVQDRSHIDLSQFSRAGYVMPGTYTMAIQVNKSSLPEQPVQFIAPDNDPDGSEACLTTDIVTRLGLTTKSSKQLSWWHNGECLDPQSLPGMAVRGDLGNGALFISLPQAYLEYVSDNAKRAVCGMALVLFSTLAQAAIH